ncbi:AAA family ATPase [Lentibacillus sp. CBA3610]|uniref:AAA family ATPase n=1 Tax=Lentibacillus sp. CBA3610 TaxID=2518176 RepID=UPI0020D20F35|nr:AAA family ATPase [Lentibacillus sp. CBA3610]
MHESDCLYTYLRVLWETISTINGGDYQKCWHNKAKQTIQSALKQLDQQYDLIFLEGAGSPVEMNLKERDLANMAVAEMADVPVILVADIDRGGAFASIAGTLALLDQEERNRVKGLIINKFHGDVTSFALGSEWLETYTRLPVLGVIPYIEHDLAEEDSLSTQEVLTANVIEKDANYEKLAKRLEKHLDWRKLLTIMLGEAHVH